MTNVEKPREFLKDFTKEEHQKLYDAALEEIHEFVIHESREAAELIMEMCQDNVESLLNWVSISDVDEEAVKDILGFWPWKGDPIPARELGITEVDDGRQKV